MPEIFPLEFDLHVLKRRGADGRPDTFTIAIWDDLLTLRSACHILPIDEALAALRQILESAGNPLTQSRVNTNHEPHTSSGWQID